MMQVILSDHNCEGQAELIFNVLRFDGTWLELVPMELKWFSDVNLSDKTNDEDVWKFCQENGYILLTGNRSTKDGEKSLEFQIRKEQVKECLPVLTIGNLKRINSDVVYRVKCAENLAQIIYDLDLHLGRVRLYL